MAESKGKTVKENIPWKQTEGHCRILRVREREMPQFQFISFKTHFLDSRFAIHSPYFGLSEWVSAPCNKSAPFSSSYSGSQFNSHLICEPSHILTLFHENSKSNKRSDKWEAKGSGVVGAASQISWEWSRSLKMERKRKFAPGTGNSKHSHGGGNVPEETGASVEGQGSLEN